MNNYFRSKFNVENMIQLPILESKTTQSLIYHRTSNAKLIKQFHCLDCHLTEEIYYKVYQVICFSKHETSLSWMLSYMHASYNLMQMCTLVLLLSAWEYPNTQSPYLVKFALLVHFGQENWTNRAFKKRGTNSALLKE